MSATPPYKCQGLLGWIFGHKYASWDGGMTWTYCFRCGMPSGGWGND